MRYEGKEGKGEGWGMGWILSMLVWRMEVGL